MLVLFPKESIEIMSKEWPFFMEAYAQYIVKNCYEKGLYCGNMDYYHEALELLGYNNLPDNEKADFYLVNNYNLGYVILYNNSDTYRSLFNICLDSLGYLSNTYGRHAMGEWMQVKTPQTLQVYYITSNTYKDVAFYLIPMDNCVSTIKYITARKQDKFISNVKKEVIYKKNGRYFKDVYIKYIISMSSKSGLLCDCNKDYYGNDLKRLGYELPNGIEGDFYVIRNKVNYAILCKDSTTESIILRICNDALSYLYNTYGKAARGNVKIIKTPKVYVNEITSKTYYDIWFYILPMENYQNTLQDIDKMALLESIKNFKL